MAKENKKATLSVEERLDAALVPDWEQPYKVPANWCWVTLGGITQVIGGGTPSSGNPDYYEGGNVPWISPADLSNYNDMFISNGAKNITELGLEKSSARMLPKDTVCLSSRAPIGYVAIAANPLSTNQGFKSFLPSPLYRPQYLYWYLKANKELLESRASGTTFLELSGSKAASIEFPLAPLAEQQRIVDLIESLFAKLDEAKEKAQAVVDGFDARRAAILHKAFTGELTAGWRKRAGRANNEWVDTPLDEVCRSIFDGDHMPPPKSETGIPFLVISNVNTGHLSFEDTRFVPQEYYDGLSSTRKPEPGDVLYTLVGSYGIPVVVDDSTPFCFQRHMALLKPSKVNTYFLWYQLQSQEFYNKASAIATGTAQLTVPIKGLRELSIRTPSDLEQSEVVRLLNELLMDEQAVKEIAEQTIERINTIKKSILARAFRGELGTNDPYDESAVELLKRVLSGGNPHDN